MKTLNTYRLTHTAIQSICLLTAVVAIAVIGVKLLSPGHAASSVPVDDGNLVILGNHDDINSDARDVSGIYILDPAGSNFDLSKALWKWVPGDSPQIDAAHKWWFLRPNDMKLRDGGKTLLIASGSTSATAAEHGSVGHPIGAVAIMDVATKKILFYAPAGEHTHSVEQLPDGNLVGISTKDNLMRIYSTDLSVSGGFPDSVVSTDYTKLNGVDLPHGIVWDDKTDRLYVVGNHGIDAWMYNKNRKSPKLTRDMDFGRVDLPTTGTCSGNNGHECVGGHDLSAVLGQRKMFVSWTGHLGTFSPDTRKISLYTPDSGVLKGANLNPSNKLLQNCYCKYVKVGTGGVAGSLMQLNLAQSKIYKARWWMVTPMFQGGTSDVPPTTNLTAPASSSSVISGTIAVSATALDDVRVASVEFDYRAVGDSTWTQIGSSITTPPYSASWNTKLLTNGEYQVRSLATDSADQTGSNVRSVTIANTTTDTEAPTITISRSPNTTTVTGDLTVAATANDNIGVTKVSLWIDGAWETNLVAPYNYTIDTTELADGAHQIFMRAFDAAGHMTQSSTLSFITGNESSAMVGDSNGDGRVNAIDLSILLSHDGSNYPPADFDGNGTVDGADASIIYSNWAW